MGKDPQPRSTDKKSAGGIYFIIGTGALFLMAFVWSIDSSFVYIFLGVAAFFFFLGFRDYFTTNPVKQSFSERVRQTYRTSSTQDEKRSPLEDFSELLKQAQQRAQAAAAQARPATPAGNAGGKKVVAFTMFFIGTIFFVMILLVSLFRSSENDTDAYDDDYYAEAPQSNVEKAESFYSNQQWDSAYFYFKRALKENPNDTTAMDGYGSSLYMLNNPDSALIMYDKALSLNPDFDLARANKAWVYNEQKNYSQALIEVREVLRRSPDYAYAYALQGDILYNQGDFQQALLSYEIAFEKGMQSNPLCRTMADLYVQQGNNPKAIEFYKEALRYDSADFYTYSRLGEIIPGEEGAYFRQRAQGQ